MMLLFVRFHNIVNTIFKLNHCCYDYVLCDSEPENLNFPEVFLLKRSRP